MQWGNQQGGGGDKFVNLTGLFNSKSGKAMVGWLKINEFNSLFAVMKEAHAKGADLMFVISDPGKNNAGGKLVGRLSVAVSEKQAAAPKAAQTGPFGSPAAVPAPAPAAPAASTSTPFGFGGQQANNPPKDELESFLEGFDK